METGGTGGGTVGGEASVYVAAEQEAFDSVGRTAVYFFYFFELKGVQLFNLSTYTRNLCQLFLNF